MSEPTAEQLVAAFEAQRAREAALRERHKATARALGYAFPRSVPTYYDTEVVVMHQVCGMSRVTTLENIENGEPCPDCAKWVEDEHGNLPGPTDDDFPPIERAADAAGDPAPTPLPLAVDYDALDLCRYSTHILDRGIRLALRQGDSATYAAVWAHRCDACHSVLVRYINRDHTERISEFGADAYAYDAATWYSRH
jgi:hypothetical protein